MRFSFSFLSAPKFWRENDEGNIFTKANHSEIT